MCLRNSEQKDQPATCELLELFAIEFSDSKISPNLAYRHCVIVGGLIDSLSRKVERSEISRLPLKIFIKQD